jgi:hypothetical protein
LSGATVAVGLLAAGALPVPVLRSMAFGGLPIPLLGRRRAQSVSGHVGRAGGRLDALLPSRLAENVPRDSKQPWQRRAVPLITKAAAAEPRLAKVSAVSSLAARPARRANQA